MIKLDLEVNQDFTSIKKIFFSFPENINEVKRGYAIKVAVENATKAWIGHGVVQTNPETYKKTIYSKDAPTNQVPGTVQEYAAFEAGPPGGCRL